jgi:hypothetical protein
MESFVAEMRWEASDAQRVRKAVHARSVQSHKEYTGVLEQISTLIGTPLRASPSRGTSQRGQPRARSTCDTFATELTDPAFDPPTAPQEQAIARHVTFEDIGSIVEKVKKARGVH